MMITFGEKEAPSIFNCEARRQFMTIAGGAEPATVASFKFN